MMEESLSARCGVFSSPWRPTWQYIVIAGDVVTVQPISDEQGVIVRVEPRRNELSRTSRKRRQILCTNVDLVLIVALASRSRS